jgi:hypothetical protein
LQSRRYVPSRHPDRTLFRVEFPFGQRPRARWNNVDYDVLDISEKGIRLNNEGLKGFVAGASVRLGVCFEDAVVSVAGRVLRANERETVIALSEGFPLERVRREERRLIRGDQKNNSSTGGR